MLGIGRRMLAAWNPRLPRDWWLIPLAAVIGTAAGLTAVGFDLLVRFSERFFFGTVAGQIGEGPWRLGLLVLLPAVGGLLVGVIRYATHGREGGPGIPMVVEALARHRGVLSIRGGLYKALLAAITIGSGGSAGVEGPILQLGSTVGSSVGRAVRLSREHLATLLGCGAAAATAAIFNAPIAGVIFVLEVVLRDFTHRTFIPIVVASVFGTAVAQGVLGRDEAIFDLPDAMMGYDFAALELAPYAALGLLCGLIGVLLALTLRGSEAMWGKVPVPLWARPALGGLALGGLGLAFVFVAPDMVPAYEPPAIFGNGYPVIEALLNPASYAPELAAAGDEPVAHAALSLLILLAGCKLLGTALTIGSGGAGGVIAPSLMLGATAGGALALALQQTGWFPGQSPASYALAGMAGVIAAVAHCPLTAFLLVFEITQDYKVVLPMMLVAILATSVSQLLVRESIYQVWLRRRGVRVGYLVDMTLLRRMDVGQVPLVEAALVAADDPAQRLLDLAEDYAAQDFVVIDEAERYQAMVVGDDVRQTLLQREAIPLMIVGELARTGLPTVVPGETLDTILDKFADHDVASLAVLDADQRVLGLVTRSAVLRVYQHELERRG
jgi:CIC family chloride channel protein